MCDEMPSVVIAVVSWLVKYNSVAYDGQLEFNFCGHFESRKISGNAKEIIFLLALPILYFALQVLHIIFVLIYASCTLCMQDNVS